ncbi:DUF998 domain-containing protein [Candidatus Bathyarchaeota archaeon]|jgi:hypothetical membrane protein|nr:DUF998 domain-containing protein [Candidatus Bathyarchaeota archaeon]MBT4423202.1 DUF998 domain-containing protein [Candidatus Bathyarchaeota archaeon]MBT7187174.1 DUF998 domain-containing protein [Candidatus Bathyarchaeota archaeon]MBT7347579.1 DUF998 domain-containing protein [Candidatus Bathyarchaeota archaeon]MBT7912886.1 DUF998 domain-containing protein [Candidatus Bathyarchaeota archaeon]
MNVKIVKIMARFGVYSSVLGAFMIGVTISLTENWSFSHNTFSELGVMGAGASILYNSGLLMAGALAMVLAAAFFEYTKGDKIGQAGSTVFLVFSLSVCVLGISILDLGDWVRYVSPAIYVMIPLSTTLLGYYLFKKGLKLHAGVGLAAAVIGATIWVMGGPVNATNQTIALAPFSVWQIYIGRHLSKLEEPNEWE